MECHRSGIPLSCVLPKTVPQVALGLVVRIWIGSERNHRLRVRVGEYKVRLPGVGCTHSAVYAIFVHQLRAVGHILPVRALTVRNGLRSPSSDIVRNVDVVAAKNAAE